jgi:hypothetical protein
MYKAGAQLIDGHLFLTEKYRADKSFEKLKAKYIFFDITHGTNVFKMKQGCFIAMDIDGMLHCNG